MEMHFLTLLGCFGHVAGLTSRCQAGPCSLRRLWGRIPPASSSSPWRLPAPLQSSRATPANLSASPVKVPPISYVCALPLPLSCKDTVIAFRSPHPHSAAGILPIKRSLAKSHLQRPSQIKLHLQVTRVPLPPVVPGGMGNGIPCGTPTTCWLLASKTAWSYPQYHYRW